MHNGRGTSLALVSALLVACSTAAQDHRRAEPRSSTVGTLSDRPAVIFPGPNQGPSDAPSTAATNRPVTAQVLSRGRRPGDAGDLVAAALASLPTATRERSLGAESIDWPGPGAAVVTILLTCDEPTPCRVGVAVVTDHRGALATDQWWPLPPASSATGSLATEPLADPEVESAARVALRLAGFDPSRLRAISVATDAWPIIAHLDHRGAGGPVVWLRRDGHRLVVAGTTGQEIA